MGMRKCFKLAFLTLVSFIVSVALFAEEITREQAEVAAGNWLLRNAAFETPLSADIVSSKTVAIADGSSSFHVMELSGGGFVITSADDSLEPILAFSATASADKIGVDSTNPLFALLSRDISGRIAAARFAETNVLSRLRFANATVSTAASIAKSKWSSLLNVSSRRMASTVESENEIPDLRVAPFIETRWNQGNIEGSPCFNYYTPNNYVAGCNATALAQIMRYYRHPSKSVPAKTVECFVDGSVVYLTMKGGVYDWDNMPNDPTNSITEEQRKSIGKVLYDAGVAIGMRYASNSSSSLSIDVGKELRNTFGYASAVNLADYGGNIQGGLTSFIDSAILAPLDYGSPVLLGIRDTSDNSGHAVLADGYGYSDSTRYIHINMGWSGMCDAWYNLPDVTYGDGLVSFDTFESCVYNIFPTESGQIVSGRVLSSDGNVVPGAVVTVKRSGSSTIITNITTTASGVYAALLPASSTYVISASYAGESASINASTTSSTEYSPYVNQVVNQTVGNSWGNNITLSSVASASAPVFSSEAGSSFEASLTITITSDSGTTIYYTTDGSTPTTESTLYTSPITITDTTTLKAIAVKSGLINSVISTATYYRTDNDIASSLDTTDIVWLNDSEYPWVPQTDNTYDGFDAIISGCPSTDGTGWYNSSLTTTVTGPITMTLYYKDVRDANTTSYYYSYFNVLVDGISYFEKTNSAILDFLWRSVSVEIPEGTHTISLSYKGYYQSSTARSADMAIDLAEFSVRSPMPKISPETSSDELTAYTFTDSLQVSLAASGADAIYYTIDGTDPSVSSARYTAPFTITESTIVKAISTSQGKKDSSIVTAVYISHKPVGPGVWTSDATQVINEVGDSGSIIISLFANYGSCGYSKLFATVSESDKFLNWAKANNVYLISCDSSRFQFTQSATNYFTASYFKLGSSDDGSIYIPAITVASGVENVLGRAIAWSGNSIGSVTYDGTVESLIAGISSFISPGSILVSGGVPIPFDWLRTYDSTLTTDSAYSDYISAGEADTDGDGFPNWAEYLCDSNPTNRQDNLRCLISIDKNGKPVIEWTPVNANPKVSYIVEGKKNFTDKEWKQKNDSHYFFRVRPVWNQ